jgi:hypothetical protein
MMVDISSSLKGRERRGSKLRARSESSAYLSRPGRRKFEIFHGKDIWTVLIILISSCGTGVTIEPGPRWFEITSIQSESDADRQIFWKNSGNCPRNQARSILVICFVSDLHQFTHNNQGSRVLRYLSLSSTPLLSTVNFSISQSFSHISHRQQGFQEESICTFRLTYLLTRSLTSTVPIRTQTFTKVKLARFRLRHDY